MNSRAIPPTVSRYQDQPELAATIDADPVFSALQAEVLHERKVQAMKWWYTYTLPAPSALEFNSITGQSSKPYLLTIEQGTDFKCCYMTASAFSYEAGQGAAASTFPMPNSGGLTTWAARGLTMRITDTRSGRDLTNDAVAFELFATPGYGLSYIKPFPFHYYFLRNSKIRFDIRNNDNADRVHYFSISLHGYKYLTPGS